jgi:hypothetical protein
MTAKRHFLAALQKSPRLRVTESELWDLLRASHGMREDMRHELRKLLDELANENHITLPKSKARWSVGETPSLPAYVQLVRAKKRRERGWKTYAWPPELDWVSALPHLTRNEEEFLYRLDRELKRNGLAKKAPLKYRSLQLTGDEKRLQELLKRKRLFAPGRLTQDQLNISTGPLPLLRERITPAGGCYLLVENEEVFRELYLLLRTMTHPPYDVIAQGRGNSLPSSIGWLSLIAEPVTSIDYLADLDPMALQIAQVMAEEAAAHHLPHPRPATAFHQAILDAAAHLGHPNGFPNEREQHAQLGFDKADELVAFLAPQHREVVRRIFLAGNRIAEEVAAPFLARALAALDAPESAPT